MGADIYSVKIVKSDASLGSEDKATGSLTTSDVYYPFGGAADLWSESWTAADINHANFGVAFSFEGVGNDLNNICYYLKATNFGFSIPAGATIDGVLAEVEAKWVTGLTVYVRVDHIRITVYYTEAVPNVIKINIGDAWKVVASMLINIGDAWKTIF